MSCNTSVEDWLRSLGLLTYTEAFIDNGYDELDICKQIGDEDLDAIGVINSKDRRDILHSVKLLREQGVNAVYFQLESDDNLKQTYNQTADREKYRQEDLIRKLKGLLHEDNCVLPGHSTNAERDPLDDLAQYYADQLYTYVQDVKDVLEYLRDGESNEGTIQHSNSPKLPVKKKNEKLLKDSRLSKSLNSIDSATVKNKTPKSPKHGIRGIFGKKTKNYSQQSPVIKGPMETAIGLANQVKMSDEDRKSLMLQVKHGDITQEEALNNFLFYEVSHTPVSGEEERVNDVKPKKKKTGIFNRGSFKRHSSGNSCEVLSDVTEKDRMELMRKIKNKEISNEEAWDALRRFGSKRDSKSKSPKLRRKESKSPKDRISASSFHIGPRFYTGIDGDISQSTSNIPSKTASLDSSPDSTPGLYRKLNNSREHNNSSEQFGSCNSIESCEQKGNYNQLRHTPSPTSSTQTRTPSPLTGHSDLRRTVSAKDSSNDRRDSNNVKRRSTVSSVSDPSLNRCSPPAGRHSELSPLVSPENVPPPPKSHPPPPPGSLPPVAPKKPQRPPKLPPNRPTLAQLSEQNTECEKPVLPVKPALPAKPLVRPKPAAKPYYNLHIAGHENHETFEDEQSMVNGGTTPLAIPLCSKGEVTRHGNTEAASEPPKRPSPLTRVSRNKPNGNILLEMIEKKLKEEEIDVIREPYTLENGKWGIPMNLVERYSCELNSTMRDVTKELDHIRIEKLQHANKKATPCELSNLRFVVDIIGRSSSMTDWLTSLGLPMYIEHLFEAGYDDITEIPYLNEEHLKHAKITNPNHIYRLIRSLENMAPLDEQTVGD